MMRRFVWFFFGVFLAAGPMLAFAANNIPIQSNVSAPACSASNPTYIAVIQQPNVLVYARAGLTAPGSGFTYIDDCWSGGQVVGKRWQKIINGQCGDPWVDSTTFNCAAPCSEGLTRDPVTGLCAAPPCVAGSQYSSGYYDYGLQPDSKMVYYGCANGCEVTFTGESPVGRQLVDGVYHYFARGSYDRTGEACTSGPSVTGSVPAIPTATCGAGQGSATMNGKTVCVDESTGTETNPYAPKPTPETTENKTTTTNPDGSTTTITETCTGDNACTTTTQTCTVAGACTSTTTNSGGGAGGGSGTGSGTGKDADGDGTPDYDSEGNPVDPQKDDADQCQKTPNAAMCKEKIPIDEEGVTDDADTKGMTAQKNLLDEKANELKAQLEGRSWERSDLGFTWNPGFPSGSCSAIEIANQSIDVCRPLGYVRDLWNYVCVFLAALAIWIRGTGALRGA